MTKWGIFNASLLLNEHGHPPFYFKIEVIIWQIFSGQSWNKNLLSLLFQRNYLKLQAFQAIRSEGWVFTAIPDIRKTYFSNMDNLDSVLSINNQTRFIFSVEHKITTFS